MVIVLLEQGNNCSQIHSLIAFSFSMLEKELYLKAYGHSGV